MKHSIGASHVTVQRNSWSITVSAALRVSRRIRIAIERVLADVEVERREVDGHELVERREDALVVELRIGLAHLRVELGEAMQHQPLELRHLLDRDAVLRPEMREVAEHPAQRVAQLAIGLDDVLEDLRAEADVVGVVGGAHPQAQDVGAVTACITSCGEMTLPSDFDILSAPFSSRMKPWVSTTSNGATPRVPQLSSSEE